jgi:hypothetical protein
MGEGAKSSPRVRLDSGVGEAHLEADAFRFDRFFDGLNLPLPAGER